MIKGKVVFEKARYEGGRYKVEGVDFSYFGDSCYQDSSYAKKSSAIARAEYLCSVGEYDKVRVIDTNSDEEE